MAHASGDTDSGTAKADTILISLPAGQGRLATSLTAASLQGEPSIARRILIMTLRPLSNLSNANYDATAATWDCLSARCGIPGFSGLVTSTGQGAWRSTRSTFEPNNVRMPKPAP